MSCKGFAEQVQWLDVVIDLGSMLAHRVKLNEPREHKTNICEIYVLFGVGPECGAFAYSLRLAAISELAGGGCTREVLEAMILIGFTVFFAYHSRPLSQHARPGFFFALRQDLRLWPCAHTLTCDMCIDSVSFGRHSEVTMSNVDA